MQTNKKKLTGCSQGNERGECGNKVHTIVMSMQASHENEKEPNGEKRTRNDEVPECTGVATWSVGAEEVSLTSNAKRSEILYKKN